MLDADLSRNLKSPDGEWTQRRCQPPSVNGRLPPGTAQAGERTLLPDAEQKRYTVAGTQVPANVIPSLSGIGPRFIKPVEEYDRSELIEPLGRVGVRTGGQNPSSAARAAAIQPAPGTTNSGTKADAAAAPPRPADRAAGTGELGPVSQRAGLGGSAADSTGDSTANFAAIFTANVQASVKADSTAGGERHAGATGR